MITVRILDRDDAAVLENVAPEVFDHPIDPAICREFLADPRHHIVVALKAGQVVGFATAVHYVHPDKPPELWINEVGVTPELHRQRVGAQLMAQLLSHARALGCREAWVLTEEDNAAARALYASAGGKEEPGPIYLTFDLAPKE
jgi:ribosomal protein S18 acetylase RimI-like enzyme